MEILAKFVIGGIFVLLIAASVCAGAMIIRDSTDNAKPPL